MILIDTMQIGSGPEAKSLELCAGDLTALTVRERADILVVSAYPGSYEPLPGSLIGALHAKGINLKELSRDKSIDLRGSHACWLSRRIEGGAPGIEFSYILCFEPEIKGDPPQVVGDIFRALYPFTAGEDPVTVAMPLIASGYQGWSPARVFAPLFEAAFNWMKNGIGIKRLRICLHAEQEKREIPRHFARLKQKFGAAVLSGAETPGPDSVKRYDLFISYSHNNSAEAGEVIKAVKSCRPGYSVFFDQLALDVGSAWQREIYEALEDCSAVLALLSPDYLRSKVCMEEYHIAHARHRDSLHRFLFPLLLRETELPYYMKALQHVELAAGGKMLSNAIAATMEKIEQAAPASGPGKSSNNPKLEPGKRKAAGARITGKGPAGSEKTAAEVREAITALQAVYGKKISLISLARKTGITAGEAEALLEGMILEGNLRARIDIRDSSNPDDHILLLSKK